MEWKEKKIAIIRLENVLASFPDGKNTPVDLTDVRLNKDVLDALKSMRELARIVVVYDSLGSLSEKESTAIIKGVEFFLFSLLVVAVGTKDKEQRFDGWLDAVLKNVPKGISHKNNVIFIGCTDDEKAAKDLNVDFINAEKSSKWFMKN